MKDKLEKRFKKMSPNGSKAWFYREFIKGKVKNISPVYFDMMVLGTRPMREDVKLVIDNFLKDKK